MSDNELPITGYLDRFSHRPGESFSAFVSVRDGGPYRARLVRVLSGDPNPDGPGVRFDDLSHRFDESRPGRRQAIHLGSYGTVDRGPLRDANAACTWTVMVRAGLGKAGEVLMAEASADASTVLMIGANGATARISSAGGTIELAAGEPMRPARWYRVWLAADPAGGRILVGQQPLDGDPAVTADTRFVRVRFAIGRSVFCSLQEMPRDPQQHFTGKLEDPAILPGFVTSWSDVGATLEALAPELLAAWDFSLGIDTQSIFDIGPQACHGSLVNLPTRAVVGARWSGHDAIAGNTHRTITARSISTPTTSATAAGRRISPGPCRTTCPAGLTRCISPATPARTGCRSTCCRRRDGPFAPIVFLASTFTYQAYANHARSQHRSGVLRPRRRMEARIRTIRTSTRSTAARPTTSIATAAAFRFRRATGRS